MSLTKRSTCRAQVLSLLVALGVAVLSGGCFNTDFVSIVACDLVNGHYDYNTGDCLIPQSNLRALAAKQSSGLTGGRVDSVISFSDTGCRSVPWLAPPPDAVVAMTGTSGWVSSGAPAGSVDWAPLPGPAAAGKSSAVAAVRCRGGRTYAATSKGLEWMSTNDLGSGVFTSPFVPYTGGGHVLLPADDAHVLLGLQLTPPGSSPVLVCDVATSACDRAGSGFTLLASDTVRSLYRTSSGAILAGFLYSGLYRSTDGGSSWTKVTTGLTGLSTVNTITGGAGSVWVTADSGVYKSDDNGQTFSDRTVGLAGYDGSPSSTRPSVFAAAGNDSTVFAAVRDEVYTSANGTSWSKAAATLPRSVTALAVTPNVLWAGTFAGMFRSTDGGSSWSSFNRGMANVSISRIAATENGSWAGTTNAVSGLFRTTDDGATWTADAAFTKRDVSAVAALGMRVVAGGQDGVFRSTDGGGSWTDFSAGISSGSKVNALALSGNVLIAGTVPIGILKVDITSDSAPSWIPIGSGSLPTSGSVTALATNGSTFVAGIDQKVYRSLDAGNTWAAGGTVSTSFYTFSGLAFSGGTLFGATSVGLFRSSDLGVTWTRSQGDLPTSTAFYDVNVSGAKIFAAASTGLYVSSDSGGSWSLYDPLLAGVPTHAVLASSRVLHLGTFSQSVLSYPTAAAPRRLVPIVLDVDTGAAHFTSDLSLTNRGSSDARLTLLYTASIGSGSGSVTDVLPRGSQLLIPDVLGYLRQKGLEIPAGGQQGGSLLVTFDGASAPDVVGALARTTAATAAPQPAGSAGLAYAGVDPASGASSLIVYGLRSSAADRSNLAIYNTTADPVTVSVTAYSGDGSGAMAVVSAAETLPGWGWKQFNRVLDGVGFTNGWVAVRRTSAAGAFGAYGVINDNATNDGSFVEATRFGLHPPTLNVPVIVETGNFVSELVLANASTAPADYLLTYQEALSPGLGAGGSVVVTLPPATQRIFPDVVDALRSLGMPVGARGAGSYAGTLNVSVSGGAVPGQLFAGARTAAPSSGGGQFGLFTPGVLVGGESFGEAWLYGLRADANNRTNVAATNTSAGTGGSVTLLFEAFDGEAGGVVRGSQAVTLAPGQWAQLNGFLAGAGIHNGWVRISRTSGTAPWIAYGVINDGGATGQRTGDGAYVPATP